VFFFLAVRRRRKWWANERRKKSELRKRPKYIYIGFGLRDFVVRSNYEPKKEAKSFSREKPDLFLYFVLSVSFSKIRKAAQISWHSAEPANKNVRLGGVRRVFVRRRIKLRKEYYNCVLRRSKWRAFKRCECRLWDR